ncbi:hypothetical protein LTR37_011729 [Vermiconidia calcicola]|uniref:Uncharacterized protein n=1 Tax=Vermiconidia calcicola TaxID=1690605 RepID=A0ACC3N1Z9_9PEZI|nr:hypothetical protein LTR37_011729 [Vermiconidia calcicola]
MIPGLSFGSSDHVMPSLSVIRLLIVACTVAYYLPSWLNHVSGRLTSLASLRRRRSIKEAVLEDSILAVSKELDFPKDWYTSEKLFQFEKRAIFSKAWLQVCHSSLFKKPGDYKTFNVAQFSFVNFGKDRKLRAFQDVCRHRAYTVTRKEKGSSPVLKCKYHGWTYNSEGKLIKAPKFEDVPGCFLYVNFDIYASDGLTIRVGVPIRARLELVKSWDVDANLNRKIAVPSRAFRVRSLAMQNKLPKLLSFALGAFESWRWPVEFELSPLTRLLRSANGELWLTIAIVPQSNTACRIACSLYCSKLDARADFPITVIKSEVSDSVGKLQLIFEEVKKDGAIPDARSQEPLLAETKAHSRLEWLMNTEVHPASQLRETSQACKVADDLCKQLETASGGYSGVAEATSLSW